MADIGTLEQLKRTHDLDLEVFTKVKDEEVEDVDMKVGECIGQWSLIQPLNLSSDCDERRINNPNVLIDIKDPLQCSTVFLRNKASSSSSRPPRLKRQETLKTSEILKSMKSLNYDNADDAATFDGVTADNYAFYARGAIQ